MKQPSYTKKGPGRRSIQCKVIGGKKTKPVFGNPLRGYFQRYVHVLSGYLAEKNLAKKENA